ncbi:MAG: ester cyclase [Actinomycetota bacterium]|nr:ester cyclase [Actinomycetota bacterium]
MEIVRRFFQDSLTRDPQSDATWRDALDLVHQDFEYREDPRWPGAGTYKGIAAFQEVVSGYFEALGEMVLEAEEIIDAGDCVVALIRFWARGASGAEAVMLQAGIFTVRDGKIATWQVVFDRAEALEAVGRSE